MSCRKPPRPTCRRSATASSCRPGTDGACGRGVERRSWCPTSHADVDLAARCNPAAKSIPRSTLPISRNRSAVESISFRQSRYADAPGGGNPPFHQLRTALYIREYNALGKQGARTAVDSMEIASSKLTTCDVAPDGEVITLNLVDAAGNPVSLRLPFGQAGALAMTLPGLLSKALKARCGNESSRYVFPLGEWLLENAADGRTLIVTLKTVD